jgi:hypothetical protein
MAGYTFSTRRRFSPPLPASRQWYYMPVALRLEPAGGEVSGTEHREEAGRTPRMTFWRPVTAGEVRPLVTLSPASISTRSDDPSSEAGWIAELEKELVRLKGSQEEEEDHRHDPYLGELFPTRSVTLAIVNHKAKTSDRADGFSTSPEERSEPGHGQQQRMAPPRGEAGRGLKRTFITRKRTQPAWTGEHSASEAISAGVGVERSGR